MKIENYHIRYNYNYLVHELYNIFINLSLMILLARDWPIFDLSFFF